MRILKIEENGMVYQISDSIEGKDVIVDITYSGDRDDDGNEILEFVYASVEEDSNPLLSEEEIKEMNDYLECGREETYLLALVEHYAKTSINFDCGEYKYNPTSVLYDKGAR